MCGITVVVTLTGHQAQAKLQNREDTESGYVSQQDEQPRGQLAPKEAIVSTQQQIDESLDALQYRGPDSHDSWISDDGRVALGSCRLEINDLTPRGNQPFHNSDGTIHAVVNGELYDHQRIREDLISQMGYTFQGRSDCEIVIALYEYYGVSFISHLRGEFALCLYDSRKQLFFASRDRSGVKPLLWTIVENRLLVASEAKAFLAYGWQPEWDVRSISDYAWLTEERTLFKGVRKIRPGSYMSCINFDFITQRQYWDHNYPDKLVLETRSIEEMVEGVRSRLLEAVRIRLQADVPVGVHLSGGIDSAVAAGMAKHLLDTGQVRLGSHGTNQKLHCLGVAFDKDSGYDESDIAQRTSDWLGVDFHTAYMDEAKFAEHFEDAVWYDEQPHPDLGFVGKHVLSRLTRDIGLKTILSGQGSDELFGGYDLFTPSFLQESDPSWAGPAPSEEWRMVQCTKANEAAAARWTTDQIESTDRDSYVSPWAIDEVPQWTKFMTLTYPQLDFAPWTETLGHSPPGLSVMEDLSESTRHMMRRKWHPLHSALYAWNKTILPNMLLTNLGDKTEMSHSVEGRVPFLDHHLMEYVNDLPPSVKIRYDPESKTLTEKWILREAAKPFITEELYERKKHPYTSPVKYPIGGPMHRLLTRLITKQNIDNLGFMDWSKTEDLFSRAFEVQEPNMIRKTFIIAEFVVMSQRFGIKTAGPDC